MYNPLLKSNNKHLINKNLDPVKVEFSSSLDTLPVENIAFTTLYNTSETIDLKNFLLASHLEKQQMKRSYLKTL